MARIAGVDLPRDKRADIGLTYIYGIGRAAASEILKEAGVDGAIRVKDLSEDKIVKLREIIRKASGETIDLKAYEADMRHLIDTRAHV